MALMAIDINSVRDYVSKYDTNKKNPTIFKIGALDSMVSAAIQDRATSYDIAGSSVSEKDVRLKTNLNVKQMLVENVRFGLRGFENFLHPITKKPIEFKTKKVKISGNEYDAVLDEILKMIPSPILFELGMEIDKEKSPSPEEIKN